MNEAQAQLAEIDAVLRSGSEPAVPVKHRGKAARPAPVAVDEDDDDERAINEDEPFPVVSAPAPRPALTVAGLPDLNAHGAVLAAKANVSRVADQQRATADEIATLETALGLKGGASARDLDTLAARILATGGTDDTADKFAKLETLRTHAKRLNMAAELVGKEYATARERAARELTPSAWEAEFKPAARASALALLALIAAKRAEMVACERLRAAGFGAPNGTFGSALLDPWHNTIVLNLVRDGWLSRDEVRAALPNLHGL